MLYVYILIIIKIIWKSYTRYVHILYIQLTILSTDYYPIIYTIFKIVSKLHIQSIHTN